MDADAIARVNQAVDDCLSLCHNAATSRETAASFCEDLAQDPQWKGAEVTLVHEIVSRVLSERGE